MHDLSQVRLIEPDFVNCFGQLAHALAPSAGIAATGPSVQGRSLPQVMQQTQQRDPAAALAALLADSAYVSLRVEP